MSAMLDCPAAADARSRRAARSPLDRPACAAPVEVTEPEHHAPALRRLVEQSLQHFEASSRCDARGPDDDVPRSLLRLLETLNAAAV
jgi:hypothetical protein